MGATGMNGNKYFAYSVKVVVYFLISISPEFKQFLRFAFVGERSSK